MSSRNGALAALFMLTSCTNNETKPAVTEPLPAPPSAVVSTPAATSSSSASSASGPLLHPESANEKAPEKYKAKFSTTKGDFVIEVTRAWAPNGADRFYNLVKVGFFNGVRFHRAIDKFMVQWGVNGDPAVNVAWDRATIPDDPVVKGNKRGFVTFAMAGPASRTTQVFINYADGNTRLDGMGFAAFGKVVTGMDIVDSLYKEYGELQPRGKGPDGTRAETEGEAYLAKEFPKLDKITTATIQ